MRTTSPLSSKYSIKDQQQALGISRILDQLFFTRRGNKIIHKYPNFATATVIRLYDSAGRLGQAGCLFHKSF